MVLSKKEKIEKFIEGAKLTGTTTLILGSQEYDYINTIVNKYGHERWVYYATVAALGSVIIKKRTNLKKEDKFDLADSYKMAIAEWNKDALDQIDELMDFVISRDLSTKDELYESIGEWVIENVIGTAIDPSKIESAKRTGWIIVENMELFMPYVKFSKLDLITIIRWILFLPATFVIAVLVGGLTNSVAQLYLPEWVSWSTSGAFSSIAFIILGLQIAPRKTKFVKGILVTTVGVIGLLSAVGSLIGDNISSAFAGITMLLIAISFSRKPVSEILKETEST